MVLVPERIRKLLKRPLGKVYCNYKKIKELSNSFKIISVGDFSTLALLLAGIKPQLAVFDYKIRRIEIDQSKINVLRSKFKKTTKLKNEPGTISKRLVSIAGALIKKGGALLIDGEEDLTALVFIKNADSKTIVIYGQPLKGVVVVMPNKKTKKRVNRIFEQVFGIAKKNKTVVKN